MTELQPTDGHVNGVGQLPLVSANANNGPAGPTTKRHRRPSVRLGDINDSNHLIPRRPKTLQHQWKQLPLKDSAAAKPSKTRPLVNLSESDGNDKANNKNLDSIAIGSWKLSNSSKSRKAGPPPLKRVRSNWGSKTDDDDKYSDDADVDDGLDFDRGGSDSELKEQTPIQSLDTGHHNNNNNNNNNNNRRGGDVRVRVSDGVELDGPSDTDARNWNNNSERNGVRVWLNQLGLGRYAPVFEVHEVDEEILPLLTLEDLKDMGINAVGSRRKMYCSIQKLGKGFT